MKTKTITQIGIVIGGEVVINHWGGGKGIVCMDTTFIQNIKITKDNILRCINDAQFGCESIESAIVNIYTRFDNGSTEFDRTIEINDLKKYKHLVCRGIK